MYYRVIFAVCLLIGFSALRVAFAYDLKDAESALESGAYQKYVETLQELDMQSNAEAQDKLGLLYCVGRIVPRDPSKAHVLFERAARGGSLSGVCHLGVCYQSGSGVNKNLPRARELFETADTKGYDRAPLFIADMYKDEKQYSKTVVQIERSRARGSIEASYELARLYYGGLGVEVDNAKADKLCREAAEAGSIGAIYHLAWNYKYAKGGMDKDYKLANQWAQKGAANGDSNCLELLADNYLYGYGVAKDAKRGLELLQMAVEQCNPAALAILGYYYETGEFVAKDKAKARSLYQLAVDRDYGPAQNSLGNMIKYGTDGSKPDAKAAFALYLKAAQKGLSAAQYNTGRALQDGKGVARNSQSARLWYEAAIKQGNPHACNQLSIMYFDGTADGIAKNTNEAIRLRMKGAKEGCPFAQQSLARDYEKGKYVKRDISKAIYWYKKSADQDADKWVAFHLGELYEGGKGVPRDKKLAIAYYKRAAALGDEYSKWRAQWLGGH